MNITRIQPGIFTRNLRNTNAGAKKNNDTPSVTSPVIGGLTQDTVTFRGKSYIINSARKWRDYGDIFKEGVDLAGHSLAGANVYSKKLINANLENAYLVKSKFSFCNFTGANLIRTNFEDANLEGCFFKNVKTGYTNFSNTNLFDTVFKGDFNGFVSIVRANLSGADFYEANTDNIHFIDSIYDSRTKFPTNFDPIEEGLRKLEDGCNIGKNFKNMKLRVLPFTNMNLNEANFEEADLKHCLFENCDMSKANLKKAYLKKTTIQNCNLNNSKLQQANFESAHLHNVDMRNANLRGASLTWEDAVDVDLRGALYDQHTTFAKGFEPKAVGMIYSEYTPTYYGMK